VHRSRTSLLALLRQRARHGAGVRWLDARYPGAFPPRRSLGDARWALRHAFEFHEQIGRERITAHIHGLNRHCKEELRKMPHVTLQTPMAQPLSSGLVCFDVKGMPADEVVKRLGERKIIASVTPYATKYARFATALLNTTADIDAAASAVRALA